MKIAVMAGTPIDSQLGEDLLKNMKTQPKEVIWFR